MELEGTESVTTPSETVSAPVGPTPERAETSSEPAAREHRSLGSNLRAHMRGTAPKPEMGSEPARAATQAQAPAQPQAQTFEPIAPPGEMSPEERALFSQLSPEMQRFLSRRSLETRTTLTRKTQELAERERENSGITEVVRPHREEYARRGISVPDLVRRSIAWDQAFKENPIQAARDYLDSYGIDPSELVNGAPAAEQQPRDASGRYLTREEAERLADERVKREFDLRAQEVSTQNLFQAIQKFQESKPLFKDEGTAQQLEAVMAEKVARLRALDPSTPPEKLLEEAYQDVVTKVEPFKSLHERLNAKPQVERSKAEGLRARQASRSISGGPGSGSPTRKASDMRENLRLRFTGGM